MPADNEHQEPRLQRIINALGDAADRYGEPPDPDPEAQALAELLAEFKIGEPGILRWTEAGRALEHIGATFSVRPARCALLAGPGLSAEEAYRAYLDARAEGQVCARVLVDDAPIPMDATGWVRSCWAHWSEESQELRRADGEWPEPEEPQPPRAELTALEQGEMIARRKTIYETLHPETKHVTERGGPGRGNENNGHNVRSFSTDTALQAGVAERTVSLPETLVVRTEANREGNVRAALAAGSGNGVVY